MSSYPTRLIPTSSSTILNEVELDSILCRWTSEDLKDADNKLNASAVFPSRDGRWKHLKDYSLNMIPPSNASDILIRILDPSDVGYENSWVEGTDGLCPNDDEFVIDRERRYFLFETEKIHGFTSSFPFPFDPKTDKNEWCSFELLVEHKPLNANYSHYQFTFIYFDASGNKIDNVSDTSFKKVIAADVRQYLIEISKFSLTEFNQNWITES